MLPWMWTWTGRWLWIRLWLWLVTGGCNCRRGVCVWFCLLENSNVAQATRRGNPAACFLRHSCVHYDRSWQPRLPLIDRSAQTVPKSSKGARQLLCGYCGLDANLGVSVALGGAVINSSLIRLCGTYLLVVVARGFWFIALAAANYCLKTIKPTR